MKKENVMKNNKKQKKDKKSKKNISLSFKIMILVVILAAAALITDGLNFKAMQSLYSTSTEVSEQKVRDLTYVSTITSTIESAQKNFYLYLFSDDEDTITETYENLESDFTTLNETFESFLADSIDDGITGDDLDNLESFYTIIQGYEEVIEETITVSDEAGDADSDELASLISEVDETADTITEQLSGMSTFQSSDIAAAKEDQDNSYSSAKTIVIGMGIFIIAASIASWFAIGFTVVYPAKRATKKLKEIIDSINDQNGDLTERIKVETNDEIGIMLSSVNTFIETLQRIIKGIKNETIDLEASIENVLENSSKSAENVTDISATMEELAASMEEVTASIESINSNTGEVKTKSEMMNSNAESGFEFATEMSERANELKDAAIKSQQLTVQIIEEIRKALEKAITNSKQVDQINELTSDILDISAQTNLLALNASIEAARAGEAGRGFAVVADEIRVLADNSRNTANNIQDISQTVNNAVEDLSTHAEKMIEFMDTHVLEDYKKLVNTGDQYQGDSTQVHDTMQYILSNAEELQNTMSTVASSISQMTSTVTESANAISNVAENSTLLVTSVDSIQDSMKGNEEIVLRLKDEVNRFKNI